MVQMSALILACGRSPSLVLFALSGLLSATAAPPSPGQTQLKNNSSGTLLNISSTQSIGSDTVRKASITDMSDACVNFCPDNTALLNTGWTGILAARTADEMSELSGNNTSDSQFKGRLTCGQYARILAANSKAGTCLLNSTEQPHRILQQEHHSTIKDNCCIDEKTLEDAVKKNHELIRSYKCTSQEQCEISPWEFGRLVVEVVLQSQGLPTGAAEPPLEEVMEMFTKAGGVQDTALISTDDSFSPPIASVIVNKIFLNELKLFGMHAGAFALIRSWLVDRNYQDYTFGSMLDILQDAYNKADLSSVREQLESLQGLAHDSAREEVCGQSEDQRKALPVCVECTTQICVDLEELGSDSSKTITESKGLIDRLEKENVRIITESKLR